MYTHPEKSFRKRLVFNMSSRKPPQIGKAPVPKNFGRMLADNFDWWEEALNMDIPQGLWDDLQRSKAKAIELDDTRNTPVAVEVAGMFFQLLPTGAKGGREFVLINEKYRIELASPKKEWCIKWRATSAALWEFKIGDIRDGLYEVLENAGCTPKDKQDYLRLSRVDYCFDIFSPAFTTQMHPRIVSATVCPRETKARGDFVVQGSQVETLTIGTGSTCQVQIYDKTKEITEASNKTWLYDIWNFDSETGEIRKQDLTSDVWRVEIRLKKDWLKSRKVNKPDAFIEKMQSLLGEAIYNRRLCQRTKDSNRRRWPLHPLFVMVLDRIGNPTSFMEIDRRPTGRANYISQMIQQNIAGSLRSLTVLHLRNHGVFTAEEAERQMKRIFEKMLDDEQHDEKIRRSQEKYELVDSYK